jgi:hypothetical protein
MKKIFTITSSLLFAAALLLAGVAKAQSPVNSLSPTQTRPGTIKNTKVALPCTVKATLLSGNNYNVKLEATNNTGAWLQQGKKIYFTFGPGSAQSMNLGVMVPDSGAFTLKAFPYTANPYTPQTQGCTAYYFK